ncbi:MAG: SRPBCC family protein [Planctomycetes bacterium]|nr:SRPBCC family protein [Planctomycetota bacterium]
MTDDATRDDAGRGMADSRGGDQPSGPLARVLRLWFGVRSDVTRGAYAATGFGLMAFKYGVETLAILLLADNVLTPLEFLHPLLSVRVRAMEPGPEWLPWAVFAWSLPFLWIAFSMSVRRAADAGISPWSGLWVLVPILNLLAMLVLAVLPSAPGPGWSDTRRRKSDIAIVTSAVLGVMAALAIAGAMIGFGVYIFDEYGASLFFATPVVMGATSAFLFNREHARSYGASIFVAFMAVFIAGLALLLFALEGAICIAMAIPLVLPLGLFGGVIGKAIADYTREGRYMVPPAIVFALPLLAGAESLFVPPTEFLVLSSVEIDAPPETVWRHVVSFPDLPEPSEWYFRAGISCPVRARIEGRGVGATRYCEFTTGTFIEPITVWDEPRRLAFDVKSQPPPMFELSPYRHVHPPHMDGVLRSTRGEFRLVPLAGGRTRLEGRTWYRFNMKPQGYWTLWSDLFIHRIHLRVLRHVKRLAEAG